MKNTDKDDTSCWSCKRMLVKDDKLGLCPDCVNKYGTPVAAAGVLGLGLLGRQALKHSGKVVKVVANVIRKVK